MRFRIVQCLCGPARHCTLAMGVNNTMPDAEAIEMLKITVQAVIDGRGQELGLPIPKMNPWCGICGRKQADWTYDVVQTGDHPDWDSALREIRHLEEANRLSRLAADILGETYDVRRHKDN